MKRTIFSVVFLMHLLAAMTPCEAQLGTATAADPRATAAGGEILHAGGSASDAAIAMMLALSVVEPQSSGIGGGGFMVHHNGANGQIETLDGRETAPAALKPDRFLGADGRPKPFYQAFPGGESVGIPGNIALAAKAHEQWGKLAWAKLFAPAIKLAEQGYTVSTQTNGWLLSQQLVAEKFPALKALYWENGAPKPVGALIKNPAQAKILRLIAAQGPRAFYTGANADALIQTVQHAPLNPAIVSHADLAHYKAKQRPPVCGHYRGYKICSMAPPSSGGTTVLQILGLLERFDMKGLGKDNPTSWHLLAEAMFMAYADRDTWLGDPDFVQVPLTGLLDKGYLAQRSALISPDRVLGNYAPGTPPGATAPRMAAIPGEIYGTTHFVAVDKWGSIATMTSTVEGPFGSQLLVNGYILNNELTDFSFAPVKDGADVANAPHAGKRPLSSMSPTIVYDAQGKPIIALGSAGGRRIIMHVAKTLVAMLDWGLDAKQAMAEPNIFMNGNALILEKGTKLDAMQSALAHKGHMVVMATLPSKLNTAEHRASGWHGAADPRGGGSALDE